MAGSAHRSIGIVSCVAAAGGCSLLVDLNGFADGEPAAVDAADASALPDASGDAAPDDAGIVDPPIDATLARTLVVHNGASVPVPAGNAACALLAADVTARMRPDLADARVAGAAGPTPRTADPLPFGRAWLCFRLEGAIPPGATASYELRYGDPDAAAPSTAGVFPFVDEFDVAPSPPRWAVRGAPVLEDGAVKLPAGIVNGLVTGAGADGIDASASLMMAVRLTNPVSPSLPVDAGNAGDYFFWFGFQRFGDFVETDPWTVFIQRTSGAIHAEHKQGGTGSPCSDGCGGGDRALDGAMHVYRIDRGPDGARFFFDDGTTWDGEGTNGDMAVMIRSSLSSSDMFVDWVRARPIVWPEPDVAVGPEKAL